MLPNIKNKPKEGVDIEKNCCVCFSVKPLTAIHKLISSFVSMKYTDCFDGNKNKTTTQHRHIYSQVSVKHAHLSNIRAYLQNNSKLTPTTLQTKNKKENKNK